MKTIQPIRNPGWAFSFSLNRRHMLPETNNSMLLGSYGDMETETFWKALSDDKVLFEVKAIKSAKIKELRKFSDVQATRLIVAELMSQLRELHGKNVDISEPYITYFRDWTDDPFGAGYHAWKAVISNAKCINASMRNDLLHCALVHCFIAH